MSTFAMYVGYIVIVSLTFTGTAFVVGYAINWLSRGWDTTKLFIAAATLVVKDRERVEAQKQRIYGDPGGSS